MYKAFVLKFDMTALAKWHFNSTEPFLLSLIDSHFAN